MPGSNIRVMTFRRVLSAAAVCVGLVVAFLPTAGCGTQTDLRKSVEITDVHSGYLDMGLVNGKSKLVPSATVRVKNIGAATLSGFQLSASFWRTGEDGSKDDLFLQHLVAKDLAPGALSEPIVITAKFGYALEGARADFFAHTSFVDFAIKVVGKVGGAQFKLGEVPVERKILTKDGSVPIM